MERIDAPCEACGQEWREATEDEYAQVTAEHRKRFPDARRPDRLMVCEGCGRLEVTLTQSFRTRPAG